MWRPLSRFAYPTQDFVHDFTTNFQAHLIFQLNRTFREAGYTEFTSLIQIRTISRGGFEIQSIELVSQYAKYIGALYTGVKKLWDVTQDRSALQKEQNAELVSLQKNWCVRVNLLPAAELIPYRFVYDADGLVLSIMPVLESSTDPAEYPHKVDRTSELLTLLAAYAKNAAFAVANLDVALHSYPLFKVMLQILDERSFDLEQVRIDAADPEIWDYINASADLEFSNWSKTGDARGDEAP